MSAAPDVLRAIAREIRGHCYSPAVSRVDRLYGPSQAKLRRTVLELATGKPAKASETGYKATRAAMLAAFGIGPGECLAHEDRALDQALRSFEP